MASVVLLRGVNVGGHKTFKPARLVQDLKHLGAVNIGAAGTFVIRKTVSQSTLRAEFARRLPFEAEIIVVPAGEFSRLLSGDPYVDYPQRPDTTRFVSVLARLPRSTPSLPAVFPPSGKWLLQVLSRDRRFVFGVYRREVKAIGYLATVDRMFGVTVTTRSWNTIEAIAKVLES